MLCLSSAWPTITKDLEQINDKNFQEIWKRLQSEIESLSQPEAVTSLAQAEYLTLELCRQLSFDPWDPLFLQPS